MERVVTPSQNTSKSTLLLELAPSGMKAGSFRTLFSFYDERNAHVTPELSSIYTNYTPVVYSIGLVVSLLTIFVFLCLCKRNTTRPQPLNHLPVTTQHQQAPPQYPPGMQIDRVIDKWRTQGMEPTLVPLQSTGRDTLAQEPKIRRNVYDLPNGKLYSGNKKIDGQFGKPDTA